MSCERIVVGGVSAIVCTRGRKNRRQCRWCGRGAAFACDATKRSRTCSAPMCAEHAREAGPDTHHCPDHAAMLGLFGASA